MSHYAQGTRFEHKVRDHLAENGYEVVRAAGSKGSSKVDLIALKPGELLFIQCKRTGLISPAEWNRVFEVSGWVAALPLVASNGLLGRGVVFDLLLDRKVPRSRTRPCRRWVVDQLVAAA
jgi:hypothetical protein